MVNALIDQRQKYASSCLSTSETAKVIKLMREGNNDLASISDDSIKIVIGDVFKLCSQPYIMFMNSVADLYITDKDDHSAFKTMLLDMTISTEHSIMNVDFDEHETMHMKLIVFPMNDQFKSTIYVPGNKVSTVKNVISQLLQFIMIYHKIMTIIYPHIFCMLKKYVKLNNVDDVSDDNDESTMLQFDNDEPKLFFEQFSKISIGVFMYYMNDEGHFVYPDKDYIDNLRNNMQRKNNNEGFNIIEMINGICMRTDSGKSTSSADGAAADDGNSAADVTNSTADVTSYITDNTSSSTADVNSSTNTDVITNNLYTDDSNKDNVVDSLQSEKPPNIDNSNPLEKMESLSISNTKKRTRPSLLDDDEIIY